MKAWLTKSISRKIGSLTDVGNAYRIGHYQSVAAYEQYVLGDKSAFDRFKTANAFMRQKDRAIVKRKRPRTCLDCLPSCRQWLKNLW